MLRALLAENESLREFIAKYNVLKAERDDLALEVDEGDEFRGRLAKILENTVNVLRGQPPENVCWSWHDLPEQVEAITAERDTLRQRLEKIPDCNACSGKGGLGPGGICRYSGEWMGEVCEVCGGTGKAGGR